MKRQHRTFLVLAVAVITAGVASLAVYRAVQRIPVREVEVASVQMVVASQPLPVGTRLEANHLRVVPWPSRHTVSGGHSDTTKVIGRGLIVPIGENEPITEAKMAALEAGAGLPPVIPSGMRAISVRVNEVVGVAGFVVPGTRVDLLVTVTRTGSQQDPMTRTVVSNVQVLTAGTRYDQEEAKDGAPVESSVVTLLLTPADAERVVLASNEGQVMLALRNPLDDTPTATNGTRTTGLFGDAPPPPAPKAAAVAALPRKIVNVPPPPPPVEPVVPPAYTVETIRAAKRAEETLR